MSRDGDMMAFVPFEGVRIFDAVNSLVGIAHYHRFFTSGDALLGAGFCASVGTLGPAFGIADPAVHSFRFRSFVCKDDSHVEECYREDKTEQQQFLHRHSLVFYGRSRRFPGTALMLRFRCKRSGLPHLWSWQFIGRLQDICQPKLGELYHSRVIRRKCGNALGVLFVSGIMALLFPRRKRETARQITIVFKPLMRWGESRCWSTSNRRLNLCGELLFS